MIFDRFPGERNRFDVITNTFGEDVTYLVVKITANTWIKHWTAWPRDSGRQ